MISLPPNIRFFFFFWKCWTDICNYNSALNLEKKFNKRKIHQSYSRQHKLMNFQIYLNLALHKFIFFFSMHRSISFCTFLTFLEYYVRLRRTKNVNKHKRRHPQLDFYLRIVQNFWISNVLQALERNILWKRKYFTL